MTDIVTETIDSPFNYRHKQGSTFYREFTYQVDGVSQVMSGYTGSFVIYKKRPKSLLKPEQTLTYISAESANGYITASYSKMYITIPNSIMAAIPAGTYDYYFDIVVFGTGDVIRVLYGLFDVVQEATY